MARIKGPGSAIAYEYITKKILSFEILAGETVSDSAIAQELQLSRTLVREAMQRLIEDGLIVKEGVRMIASPITEKDIQEICQVREALENKAVALILKDGGLSEEQLRTLNDINSQMRVYVEDRNFEKNFSCDDLFHMTILEFSKNGRLIEYFEKLRLQIARARWLTVIQAGYTTALSEHQAIIDALADRDLGAAQKAVNTHMENSERNFSGIFGDGNVQLALSSLKSILPQVR